MSGEVWINFILNLYVTAQYLYASAVMEMGLVILKDHFVINPVEILTFIIIYVPPARKF